MTDIDALAIELHKHLFVTVTDWRDEAGDWDSLGEQAKSEYRLVARRVRDMVTGPPAANPGDTAGYAPCPTCKQYSHSIGCDNIAAAFNHFQSMHAHPVRGHPMGHNFDADTRDAAQALMGEITALRTQCDVMAKALGKVATKLDGELGLAENCCEIARAALQSYRTIRAEIK